MNETDQPTAPRVPPLRYRWQSALAGLIGRRVDHVLEGISDGQLLVTWPDGHTTCHGQRSEQFECNAHVTLHSYKALRRFMLEGEVGFAESYLEGDWSTDNLQQFFSLIMRNESRIDHALEGSWFARMGNAFKHVRNRNSLRGSQRNISFHYDLGNDFYRLWLDESMSYSSGIYRSDASEPEETLSEAQQQKLRRVSTLLQPTPGARVLEIGCGWGAMARQLASESGCEVTGISLSKEQLDYARQHHHVAGSVDGRGATEFRHQDYRAVQGRFDHIVSIEMFEAVGEQYWRTYFGKLSELLDQGGTAVLQVITILEDRFEQYRAKPDFIQRYIFPGGMLPSKAHLHELIDSAGFDLVQTDWFGPSYARTLARWRERFEDASRDVVEQGFDERFMRMWRYYLAYCEAGFRFGSTDVGMLMLAKR